MLRRRALPFLKSGSSESFDRFRIALNGCFWDNGLFCNEPTDGGRWETLRRELRLEVRDYRKAGDHILLVGQVPGDVSLYWRRRIRYSVRRYQFLALREVFLAKGFTAMPSRVEDLATLADTAPRLAWRGADTLFDWLALRRMRNEYALTGRH